MLVGHIIWVVIWDRGRRREVCCGEERSRWWWRRGIGGPGRVVAGYAAATVDAVGAGRVARREEVVHAVEGVKDREGRRRCHDPFCSGILEVLENDMDSDAGSLPAEAVD